MGKYGPEKAPYLDSFRAVYVNILWLRKKKIVLQNYLNFDIGKEQIFCALIAVNYSVTKQCDV